MHDRSGPADAAPGFLPGGGDMGERIRVFDWSASSLGPLEAWPQSLKTSVDLLLHSPVPMVLLWGAEGVMIYNDAYSGFAGGRHPRLLGSKVLEGWPEVADFNRRVMEVGLSGGTLSFRDQRLVLHRHGVAEDVWMNLDYSPIRDESGRPAGVLAIVVETTPRIRAERRVSFQLRLAERMLSLSDPAEIKAVASEALGRELGVARVGYAEVEPDGEHITVAQDWTDGTTVSVAGRHHMEDFGPPIISELRAGTTIHVDDVAADPRTEGAGAEAFAAIDCLTVLAVPLIRGGRFVAMLFLQHREPRRWTPLDVSLAEDVAARTWSSVERARTEAALRESEARFRAMADSAPAPVFMTDAAGALVFVNSAFEAFAGAEAEALMSGLWLALLHPDDMAEVAERRRQAWADHSAYAFEARFRGAEGEWLWMLVSARPRMDGAGVFQGYVGMAIDLTDRRQAEDALRNSEQRFRELADNIPTLCWVARADGHIIWYNQRWYDYTGTSVDDQEGWGWESVHDPQVLPRVMAGWTASLESGEPFEMTFPLKGADGAFRPFLTRVAPIREEHGRVVRWFGTNTDIAEQVAAEEALRESETRFRTLADSAPAPAWVTDGEGAVAFVNQAFEDYAGLPREALFGHGWTELLHPNDLTSMMAARRQAWADHSPYAVEARFRRADGQWRWMQVSSKPRFDGSGAFQGYTGIAVDVTEARLAADELEAIVRERTEELQAAEESLRQAQKMEAVGQLTGGIAHDFNNLLTAVVGGLDMIQRRAADERTKRIAANALQAAERGAKLTSQLLAFSRTQRLAVEPVPVNATIERMAELLAGALGSTVELRFHLDPHAGAALTDANQLELAVLNLAINARDALGGRGKVTVSTTTERVSPGQVAPGVPAGDYVVLAVSDDGPGMSADVLARAFDPFYTTKPVGQGTGLGLSQVYGIARQSGGAAVIESEIGRGTAVRIYLPVAEGDAEPADAPTTPAATAQHGGRRAVLVVDDDPDVRRFIVDSLESLGFHVLEAEDGPSGLELFGRERPDLLLLDFAMPGMNGAEVAERARRVRPEQRVLFASGYADTDAIEHAAGDAAVLRKPFRLTDLAAAVEGALA